MSVKTSAIGNLVLSVVQHVEEIEARLQREGSKMDDADVSDVIGEALTNFVVQLVQENVFTPIELTMISEQIIAKRGKVDPDPETRRRRRELNSFMRSVRERGVPRGWAKIEGGGE